MGVIKNDFFYCITSVKGLITETGEAVRQSELAGETGASIERSLSDAEEAVWQE